MVDLTEHNVWNMLEESTEMLARDSLYFIISHVHVISHLDTINTFCIFLGAVNIKSNLSGLLLLV